MSAQHKQAKNTQATPRLSAKARRAKRNNDYVAVPRGEIDYDLLYEEVTAKYPKIIAYLAG